MPVYGAIPRAAYRQQPRRQPRSLGFERYALRFDDTQQAVDCGADPSLKGNSNTVEIIAKAGALGPAVQRMSWYYWVNLNNRAYLAIPWADNRVYVAATINGVAGNHFVGLYTLADLNYHHYVCVFDGVNWSFYVDGEFMGSEVTDDWGAMVGNPIFRVSAESVYYLDGLVPLLRIYDCALVQDEIEWNLFNYHNPVRPGNLALWLPMEEGAGLTAFDHSGHGNDGALLPALTPPVWDRVKQWELRAETE